MATVGDDGPAEMSFATLNRLATLEGTSLFLNMDIYLEQVSWKLLNMCI